MLSENIKSFRKAKGMSQEELAVKLNVVRQTVSKWEKALSVPDAEMLIRITEELDTTVNVLLGESVGVCDASEIKALSVKLELLNERLAKQSESRRKILRAIFVILGTIALIFFINIAVEQIYLFKVVADMSGDIGIIGGTDSPTYIYVSNVNLAIPKMLGTILLAVVSSAGIYIIRRR